MRFWDASALVPLCVQETTTQTLRRLAEDGQILIWCLASVEVTAAIERRSRERRTGAGGLDAESRRRALGQLRDLDRSCAKVTETSMVSVRARRILGSHSLRAADSLQLAAALVAFAERTEGRAFVCLDERLREAAAREGFTIVP